MIKQMAQQIYDEIFPSIAQKKLSLFLVGAGPSDHNSIREKIRKMLVPYNSIIETYYPEDIFDELIQHKNHFDLLSLENLLAESVHSVIMILESPGAIAELGAFSNHSILKNKLIVIIDQKFKKHKSFIMLGPIRYLKKHTSSIVLFHDFKKPDIQALFVPIIKGIQKISKHISIDLKVTNPITAQYYVLTAIYLLEPVSKEEIIEMIGITGSLPPNEANIIAHASLSILHKRKEVSVKKNLYHLTQVGLQRFNSYIPAHFNLRLNKGKNIRRELDLLRIEALNKKLRREKRA